MRLVASVVCHTDPGLVVDVVIVVASAASLRGVRNSAALLTRTSTRPSASMASPARVGTAAGSARSP